jgi:two-component system, NarL family, response regulator YdfI
VTRVLLIAASPRARDRLHDLLDAAGAEVVGSAPDLETFEDEFLETAEVVLIDASSESPDQLLETLQEQGILSESQVVLVSVSRSQLWTNQALRAGVRGILRADLSASQLRTALDAVLQGFVVLHADGGDSRAHAAANETATIDLVEPLTTREKEVLQMLAQGRGNKDIAARLKISEHTVKFHVASILGKLAASTRTEAVSIALRRGLILF